MNEIVQKVFQPIIGGRQANVAEDFAGSIGADEYAPHVSRAAALAKSLISS